MLLDTSIPLHITSVDNKIISCVRIQRECPCYFKRVCLMENDLEIYKSEIERLRKGVI